MKIHIFGDCNLDVIVKDNLELSYNQLSLNSDVIYTDIVHRLGGSAFNVAKHFNNSTFEPHVYTSYRKEEFYSLFRRDINLNSFITWHHSGESGVSVSVLIRDVSAKRTILNSKRLTANLIENNIDTLKHGDILYLSGYLLLENVKKIKCVNSFKGCKIIDIVPHNIYNKISNDLLIDALLNFDIIITDLSTLRRIIKIGSRGEMFAESQYEETVNSVKQQLSGFNGKIIMRGGTTRIESQYVYDFDSKEKNYRLVPKQADNLSKTGFGDKLFVEWLCSHSKYN